jgi:hypothetical protein
VRTQLKDQQQDIVREEMLARWTEEARKRIPEAIRQGWSIVVTVGEQNEIQAFKVTVGSEPLFATVKAEKRARIQDTAINAEAILPGGPYDLWREDEPSRRVKDLVSAFAENPKLPKMLRQKETLDTIDQGVTTGILVASLARPDKSVRTWWRMPLDETARKEPALEVFLPEKAALSELHPGVLAHGILPNLWTGESITVADVVGYFSGGRTVMVQREGYEEPVAIPACPSPAVEAAVSDAVRQGILWLVNGPASFQGEPVPAGILTHSARLRAPLQPLSVDCLMQNALPEAWKNGQTTALGLSVSLSAQAGYPIPWTVLRRVIDDAVKARWLELAPDSAAWPCEMSSASSVILKQPTTTHGTSERPPEDYAPTPKDVYIASAALEPSVLQDVVDVLPDIIKAAAGVPLQFRLSVTLGNGQTIDAATVASVNKLLEGVHTDLRLKT